MRIPIVIAVVLGSMTAARADGRPKPIEVGGIAIPVDAPAKTPQGPHRYAARIFGIGACLTDSGLEITSAGPLVRAHELALAPITLPRGGGLALAGRF